MTRRISRALLSRRLARTAVFTSHLPPSLPVFRRRERLASNVTTRRPSVSSVRAFRRVTRPSITALAVAGAVAVFPGAAGATTPPGDQAGRPTSSKIWALFDFVNAGTPRRLAPSAAWESLSGALLAAPIKGVHLVGGPNAVKCNPPDQGLTRYICGTRTTKGTALVILRFARSGERFDPSLAGGHRNVTVIGLTQIGRDHKAANGTPAWNQSQEFFFAPDRGAMWVMQMRATGVW